MITVDLFWAMTSFLFLSISLVIGRWVFYNYREDQPQGDSQHLQQCPYCAYIFFDYEEASFRVCPRCESYISHSETEESGSKNMKNKSKSQLTNESGVVLVTVVIMTLVMMILAVAIMSSNVNQAVSNEHQIERIKAEQLAKGAFWVNIGGLSTPAVGGPMVAPAFVDEHGKPFTPSVVAGPVGGGPDGTTAYTIQVSYPKTF